MRENPGLAATVPVAPPLSRRGLRSRHPGKRPPGCKAPRRGSDAPCGEGSQTGDGEYPEENG
ncbi:hypothetical protein WR13_26265 [Escherichia coli]|nr:hypothetical protein WR13_26265 [Escherichia coli]